jgi:hypothetical protein
MLTPCCPTGRSHLCPGPPSTRSSQTLAIKLVAAFLLAWIWAESPAIAQAPPEVIVNPQQFGLDLPPGPMRAGGGRRVVVASDPEPVVGRILVEVGDYLAVMLPNGRIVTHPTRDVSPTDRPFAPASPDRIGEQLAQGPLARFRVRNSRHFVFVSNASDEFTTVTARMLESMVPGLMGFAELMKLPANEPELPMPVIIFRTQEEYRQFGRMPPGVIAYYNVLENYVALCEENSLVGVRPELALQLAFSTIAHEGAHQILGNIGVQQRLSRWPMWLSEGLAEYLAPTAPGKKLRWKGAGQINDSRMFELENYLKSRDSDPADGQMIEHTVLAGRLTSTGYASAWALVHHLAKNHRPEFQRLLSEASRLGPLQGETRIEVPGICRANLAAFTKTMGNDLGGIEQKLVAHLKRQPYVDPFADLPHFAAIVTSGNGNRPRREANVFHTREQAEKWSADTMGRLPDDMRGSAKALIRAFPNRAAAEAFARQARP